MLLELLLCLLDLLLQLVLDLLDLVLARCTEEEAALASFPSKFLLR